MPRAELPPAITYVGDGTPQRIIDRVIVRYQSPHEVRRGGQRVIEYQEISYTVGTVKPA